METKIILELCYNHNGDIELAKKMIREAAELGVWAVKFQKWDIDSIPEERKKMKRDTETSFGKTYYEHRKNLELSIEQLLELKEYAEKKSLVFMCSGKDYNSVVELYESGITEIKLPSQLYLEHKIFKYLQKKNCNVYVSTGQHTQDEILSSVWPKVAKAVMHCVSAYPPAENEIDYAWFCKAGIYNGYSSHEKEGHAIPFFVQAGADYIERHYTFDKDAKGSDHCISSDKAEMENIIKAVEKAEKIRGTGKRELGKSEVEIAKIYRGVKWN